MFETKRPSEVDQILALMQAFQADPRDSKVDLVVGVYKDETGAVPVMRAVKAAERRLVETQATKTYLGIAGSPQFRALVAPLLLGEDAPQLAAGRVVSLQTPGGSGALRVGCDVLANLTPDQKIWVSTPTWANHIPVAERAGLRVAAYPYFRPADRRLDFGAMMDKLDTSARAGEVVLLHACCHSPTGVDLSLPQWRDLTELLAQKGLIPFVDCAYQGMGDGLEDDVAGLRHMAAHVPEMLIASSFSKNFGIYAERTGALTLMGAEAGHAQTAFAAAENMIRTNYSMPPDHGAQVVTTILTDPDLRAGWAAELAQMRGRIADMRQSLRQMLEQRQVTRDLSFLTDQKGMFSYTGFTPDQVTHLREAHGIYMADDGRINVAGLSQAVLPQVADGFAAVLR
ncbi:amino acid aminotransferase [Gymnodinialimonas sp. 2305UL16-5]|uniref:amino acid aminotransferase n=1 Tax=Gymnodinialimonas mytili TaxID=3126503 RepID=UPI0030AF758C